jgi:predicted phage terminase large subunit-like protein
MELDFQLHEKQQEVFFSEARFKVAAAGRRAGKTFLAAVMLVLAGLEDTARNGRALTSVNVVWYIAPTYQQAKEIMWAQLKDLARPVTKKVLEKELTIVLINGRSIVLKGSDREETLRGMSLGYIVLDEYADMKPDVFDIILRPALTDMEGGALFIGTPKGKNHFFDMHQQGADDKFEDWESFSFASIDNPLINPKEVEHARQTMSKAGFAQEFLASFYAAGGNAFKDTDFRYMDKLPGGPIGTRYIAVDPNGYKDTSGLVKSKMNKLDETSIAVVELRQSGWYVLDMIHGRWGIRETALKIIRAAQKYRPASVGVENMDAIKPYLEDKMRELNVFPTLVPLKHGGQKKTDRIIWSLQGRFENHKIHFIKAPWNEWLENQLLDFPSKLAHDDGPDSLAYIDQLGTTVYYSEDEAQVDDWEPLDEVAGY